MSKRRTQAELDGLLKFVLGLTLGAILFFTTMGILYALVFVEQPLNMVNPKTTKCFLMFLVA
jgi:hypothetical protein